jgi:hypothetical protein
MQEQELWLEEEGPNGLFAIFQEDEGTGSFYVYEPTKQTVLASVRLYVRPAEIEIRESDVQVMWSADQTKCGVTVWGRMRAILDIQGRKEIFAPLENRLSNAVTDPEWLKGFEDYLDQNQFIRARQSYWAEIAKEHGQEPLPEEQTPIETNFILYSRGPHKTFAVFEDFAETGYLYLYSAAEHTVLRFLLVYNCSSRLQVTAEEVEVMWAAGGTKCGVAIWGEMRGIIDLAAGREGRVKMDTRDTPGIGDQKWLEGF